MDFSCSSDLTRWVLFALVIALAEKAWYRSDMDMPLAFLNLGGQEMIVLLILVLILFGAKKLPELARGLGQSMNEFQKARDEFTKELKPLPKEVAGDVTKSNSDNNPT